MIDQLRVHEIYISIQGESTWAGLPCIFIRLTGCPLRCSYCDTAYAFKGGTAMSLASILQEVRKLAGNERHVMDRWDRRIKLPLVELTGGEPLAQPASIGLMEALGRDGFTVLLETSGAMDTQFVPEHVHTILDVKTPSSGESHRFFAANLNHLKPHDEVKFVVSTEEDLEYTKQFILKHAIEEKCSLLVSWAAPLVESQKDKSLKVVPASMVPVTRQRVVEYILQEQLPVRFQLQMHKFIWPPDQKGV